MDHEDMRAYSVRAAETDVDFHTWLEVSKVVNVLVKQYHWLVDLYLLLSRSTFRLKEQKLRGELHASSLFSKIKICSTDSQSTS